MLLLAPAFADTALQKVSLDRSLEEFLGYGYDNAVYLSIVTI